MYTHKYNSNKKKLLYLVKNKTIQTVYLRLVVISTKQDYLVPIKKEYSHGLIKVSLYYGGLQIHDVY